MQRLTRRRLVRSLFTVAMFSLVDIVEWRREQDVQRRRIENTCEALRDQNISDLHHTLTKDVLKKLNHFFVLDSHKLIYCYLPKVGSTSWKRIFLLLLGTFEKLEDISHMRAHYTPIPKLSDYSLKEAERRLAEYTTFMFTRDPLQRIISCYRDKLEKENPDNRALQKSFIGKLRPYLNSTESVSHHPGFRQVKFGEFVRYVSDPQNVFHSYDATEHWMEMYKMCHPCLLKYDYIGEFDHLTRDASIILEETGLRRNISFPEPDNPTNSSGRDLFKVYLSQLKNSEVAALNKRYEIDTFLFGYSPISK
ncbi:carbohydrate sulfotransferase 9-like [Patiria miniata]|uniref:Carbohydrate sulfotransferase n=1 Tax=Patiria miniata TaxID=46514 RepID=A0A913ZX63_PATMI|nr:carbohydrate sulfotransferase 9-like [Patiria miniata]